jgi:hypothetical protein
MDGERVLVVAVANVSAMVLLVGATVNDALRVMYIAILWCGTERERFGCVIHVDKDQASGARATTRLSSSSNSVFLFLVYGKIVRCSKREA